MNTNKRVLLVDDDPKFRAAMVYALRGTKCLVAQVPTIREANVEIGSGPFDLIILDGDLPDGSGVDWLRRLRKKGVTSPVVFVSASVRDGLSFVEMRKDLGVCLVLHKPISIQVFKEEIGRLLNKDSVTNNQAAGVEVSDELSELAADYARELPARLQKLSTLILNAECPPHNHGFIEAAAREAHMLRGTAGLFGFVEVGQSMGCIEDTFRTMMSNERALYKQESWKAIQVALASAREEARTPSVMQTPQPNSKACAANFDAGLSTTERLRVLLFDDDRTFTRRVEAILSAEGILVYSFLDTEHLEDLLNEVSPDVVLLDLNMPGPSGLDICRLIRNNEQWSALPVLIVTATDNFESQIAAMEAGADGYLSKFSVNMKLLNAVKSQVLNSSRLTLRESETHSVPDFTMPKQNSRLHVVHGSDLSWQPHQVYSHHFEG